MGQDYSLFLEWRRTVNCLSAQGQEKCHEGGMCVPGLSFNTYTHTHTHTHTHTFSLSFELTHTHILFLFHTHTHTHAHTLQAHTHTHNTHTVTHSHTHIITHAHTHCMHMHTCIQKPTRVNHFNFIGTSFSLYASGSIGPCIFAYFNSAYCN